jgi:ribosomal subunit interface protein
MEPSEALRSSVENKADWLERFYDKIQSCRVVIDSPHRHHQKGNLYQVKIHVTVPGEEILVNREPAEHQPHEDCYLAVNDAFDEAARRLEDYVQRRRRRVKRNVAAPHARVVRLFEDDGYGFLEARDGHEVYFHENSVLNRGFKKLEVGTEVRFTEEGGEKGPQASTVEIVGKSGHRRK